MAGDLLGSYDKMRENFIDIKSEVDAVMIEDKTQDLDDASRILSVLFKGL